MEILTAGIADIEELTQVEISSKLRSFKINEAYAVDHHNRSHRWKTYFAGQSPVSAKPGRIVLKAVIDGRIIGYISGHLTERHGTNAEIESFYVLKDHQRRGIGLKLLLHFKNWLIRHKANSLCVGFEPENTYRAFYLKHGGRYLNPHWIVWDSADDLK